MLYIGMSPDSIISYRNFPPKKNVFLTVVCLLVYSLYVDRQVDNRLFTIPWHKACLYQNMPLDSSSNVVYNATFFFFWHVDFKCLEFILYVFQHQIFSWVQAERNLASKKNLVVRHYLDNSSSQDEHTAFSERLYQTTCFILTLLVHRAILTSSAEPFSSPPLVDFCDPFE